MSLMILLTAVTTESWVFYSGLHGICIYNEVQKDGSTVEVKHCEASLV
jgi:hypothetical protein